MDNDNLDTLVLETKSRKQVALEYKVSCKTLGRWIKKAGLRIPTGLISPFWLKVIYQTFGTPKGSKLK